MTNYETLPPNKEASLLEGLGFGGFSAVGESESYRKSIQLITGATGLGKQPEEEVLRRTTDDGRIETEALVGSAPNVTSNNNASAANETRGNRRLLADC